MEVAGSVFVKIKINQGCKEILVFNGIHAGWGGERGEEEGEEGVGFYGKYTQGSVEIVILLMTEMSDFQMDDMLMPQYLPYYDNLDHCDNFYLHINQNKSQSLYFNQDNARDDEMEEEEPQLPLYPFESAPESLKDHTEFSTEDKTKPSEDEDTQSMPDEGEIVFEKEVIERYHTVFQGEKNDTMQLNINFKTSLSNFLQKLTKKGVLNEQQKQGVKDYDKMKPSFEANNRLFRTPNSHNMRVQCLQYFSSSQCIADIFSSRCKEPNRIMMIKFIEKMRINISDINRIVKWKDSTK